MNKVSLWPGPVEGIAEFHQSGGHQPLSLFSPRDQLRRYPAPERLAADEDRRARRRQLIHDVVMDPLEGVLQDGSRIGRAGSALHVGEVEAHHHRAGMRGEVRRDCRKQGMVEVVVSPVGQDEHRGFGTESGGHLHFRRDGRLF